MVPNRSQGPYDQLSLLHSLPNIFKSFKQIQSSTTRRYGGTGLGMTIVQRLVHAFDGSISVRSTELIKFGEYIKTLPVPTSMNLFRMTPLRGNALMVFETRLVFTLVEMFFGGSGEVETKSEGRDFTEIEARMIKRVIISGLEDLQTSWRPVFPVQINYARTEVNPQFVSIVPHSEIVVVVTVTIGRD